MTNCDWTEKVSLLIDGELAAGEARALELHVANCPACQLAREDFLLLRHRISSYHAEVNLLAQRRTLQSILGSARRNDSTPLPARRRDARNWRERAAGVFALPRLNPGLVAASAALLLLCVAVGLLMLRDGKHGQQQQQLANAPRGGQSNQSAPSVVAASPTPKVEEARVVGPNVNDESDVAAAPARELVAKIRPRGAGVVNAVGKFRPKGPGGAKAAESLPGGTNNLDVAKLPREVVDVPFTVPPRVAVEEREFSEAEIASAHAGPGGALSPPAMSAARHAEQAQQLLRSFRNAGAAEATDLTYERGRSQQLLYRNIVLRREAARGGDATVEATLSQLEPILLDIANLPDRPARGDVRSINERMEKKNLVAMLQIAARD